MNLDELHLGGTNYCWGCVPRALKSIATSDLEGLGLEFCAMPRLPVTGGPTASGWLLTALGLAGVAAIAAGAVSLRRRGPTAEE